MLEIVLAGIYGWLAGIVVNALSDDLPYRRRVGLPAYADGTQRPVLAWSGILAFLTGQRYPSAPQPDETRKRAKSGDSPLSLRYPLTEIGTIALCILSLFVVRENPHISIAQLLVWMLYMPIFVLIIVIDMEHKLILFVVTIPSMVLALLDAQFAHVIGRPFYGASTIQDALLGGLVGFVPFFLMYQGGFLFTYIMGKARGEEINTVAFGYGDVIMMTLSGLILGISYTVLAIFIAVFLGAFGAFVYIVFRSLLRQRYSLFTAIPYGPYIVIATIAMLLFGPELRLAMLGW